MLLSKHLAPHKLGKIRFYKEEMKMNMTFEDLEEQTSTLQKAEGHIVTFRTTIPNMGVEAQETLQSLRRCVMSNYTEPGRPLNILHP